MFLRGLDGFLGFGVLGSGASGNLGFSGLGLGVSTPIPKPQTPKSIKPKP